MLEDAQLDQLFAAARAEDPAISYARTRRRFLKALGPGFFSLIALKWMQWTRHTKIIVMLSTLGIAVTSALWFAQTTHHAHSAIASPQGVWTQNKIIEAAEDGSATIIYLDDARRVVHIVEQPATALPELAPAGEEEQPAQPSVRTVSPLSAHEKSDSLRTPGRRITFELTRNILDADMERIQQEARKAGVEFRYSLIVWRGKVKKCKFDLYLKNADHECAYNSELKGNFRKTIGWEVDSEGKATAIITE